MASEGSPNNEVTHAKIDTLKIPLEWKELIKLAAGGCVKMTMENIVRIWQIDEKRPIPGLKKQFLWVEDNLPNGEYQYMLDHAQGFEQLGVTKDQLSEVAEAATIIGIPGRQLGVGFCKELYRRLFASINFSTRGCLVTLPVILAS